MRSGIFEYDEVKEITLLKSYIPTYRDTEVNIHGKGAYIEEGTDKITVYSYEGWVDLDNYGCGSISEVEIFSPMVLVNLEEGMINIDKLVLHKDTELCRCDYPSCNLYGSSGMVFGMDYESFNYLHINTKVPYIVYLSDDKEELLHKVEHTEENVLLGSKVDTLDIDEKIADKMGIPILLTGYDKAFVDRLLMKPNNKYIWLHALEYLTEVWEEYLDEETDYDDFVEEMQECDAVMEQITVLATNAEVENLQLGDWFQHVYRDVPCSNGTKVDILIRYDAEWRDSNEHVDIECAYVQLYKDKLRLD